MHLIFQFSCLCRLLSKRFAFELDACGRTRWQRMVWGQTCTEPVYLSGWSRRSIEMVDWGGWSRGLMKTVPFGRFCVLSCKLVALIDQNLHLDLQRILRNFSMDPQLLLSFRKSEKANLHEARLERFWRLTKTSNFLLYNNSNSISRTKSVRHSLASFRFLFQSYFGLF